MHCSWDLQVLFFNKNNFKTGSHGTIYTFKNYFATVFSVFSNLIGLMHCSWDPQVLFINKNNFKTGFNDIIYTFKNYFATVFSVISGI